MKRAAQIGKALAAGLILFVAGAIVTGVVWWARMPKYAGRSVQHWFARADQQQWMGNASPEKIKQVEFAFQEMGSNAVPFLLEKFTMAGPNANTRQWELYGALRSSRWIPQGVKDMIPPPFTGNEQMTAHHLLSAMASKAILAQPTLEQILSRPGPLKEFVDYQVLNLFEKMGESASNSAPVIARCFASTNDSVQSGAVRAFAAITPQGSPHARLLRDAVAAGDVRAARALPRFKKWDLPIEEFFPKLGEELCSTSGVMHAQALEVIKGMRIQKEVLVPNLGRAMTDPDPRFRAELLKEVRSMGAAATEAVPAVFLALDDAYSYMRVEAVKTLLAVQPEARKDPEVVAKLRSMLSDPNEHVVETVQSVLDK